MMSTTQNRALWRVGLVCICVISTAAYIAFSDLVRVGLKSLWYLDFLLRNFPAGHEPLFLLLFALSCLLSGALASRQFRQWCPSGPTFCLFALAAVVVPPQMVALARWPDGRGAIRSAILVAIGAAINVSLAIWALLSKPASLDSKEADPGTRQRWGWGGIYLAVTTCLFALVLISAPGNLVGPDALAYHLPLVASLLRTGSLTTGPAIQFQYPGNAGLLFRWILASGSDRCVFAVPFFCATLTVYMLYLIGRAVGYSREIAVVCSCCAAVCPVFVYLSTAASSDAFGCLCVILAAYYFITWSRDSAQAPWPFMVCIGLSVGMAAGAKYSTLTLGAVVAASSLVLAWTRLKGIWQRTAASAILAASAFAGGGYWYVRNLSQFGNPVYPLEILGFPGIPMRAIGGGTFLAVGLRWASRFWTEYPYDNPFELGVGAVFGALCIPAMLLCPVLFWRWRKQGTPAPREAKLLCFLVLASMYLHALLENLQPRYALAPSLLAFVLIGFLWSEADSRFFRVAVCLPFATTLFFVGASFFTGLVYQSNLAHLDGAERFGLPKAIDEIKPARILNAGPQFYTYGLMGKDYRHKVISLFADATPQDALKYHADYVFVRESEAPKYQAALNIALLAEAKSPQGERFSLWRILPKSP